MNTAQQLAAEYPLMEHFYTLQGEGYYTGQAAYFLRLAGCDVGCVWCDVKESWDATLHPSISTEQMLEYVKQHPGRIVVITGGEPAMHNLDALTQVLKQNDFRTHIETSGAHPLTGTWDWVTLSPKKFMPPIPSTLALANELKIIVYNASDFAWAAQYAALVSPTCKLYLQPEWSKKEIVTPLIIDYIQQNPQWQLSLQTHKYINIP